MQFLGGVPITETIGIILVCFDGKYTWAYKKILKNWKICLRTYYIAGHIKQPRGPRVGQPWLMACKSISSKIIQSDMNYIAKNTSLQLATQAVTDEQRNFVTTAVLLHTSVLWFSHIESILADSCVIRTSCMNIVRCLHSVRACLATERVIVRVVHGTYLSVPFPSHPTPIYACLISSHPMGRFPWDSHRNDIPMDKPGDHAVYLSSSVV